MFARVLIAAVLAGVVGCNPHVVKQACMTMGGSASDALVANAQLLRLDVYGDKVSCAGANVPADAGAPQMSRTFAKGDAITMQIPPGVHALVLTTFSDSAGLSQLGRGCMNADLTAGAQVCFDLTLSPAGYDGGCSRIDTADNCGACGAVCSIGNDNSDRLCAGGACHYTCAAGFFDCNAGAGSNTDGCECNDGSGCCPAGADGGSSDVGGCMTQHDDGVGQSFFDCAPRDTYTKDEAMAACAAYATAHGGKADDCTTSHCDADELIVCNLTGKATCYCFGYGGDDTGNVDDSGNSCGCAIGDGWPTWH